MRFPEQRTSFDRENTLHNNVWLHLQYHSLCYNLPCNGQVKVGETKLNHISTMYHTYHSKQEIQSTQTNRFIFIIKTLKYQVFVGLYSFRVSFQDARHGQQTQVLHCEHVEDIVSNIAYCLTQTFDFKSKHFVVKYQGGIVFH